MRSCQGLLRVRGDIIPSSRSSPTKASLATASSRATRAASLGTSPSLHHKLFMCKSSEVSKTRGAKSSRC